MRAERRRRSMARATAPRRSRRSGPQRLPLVVRLNRALPWALAGLALMTVITGVIWLPRAMDAYPLEQVRVEGVDDERRQQQIMAVVSSLVREENFFSVPLPRLHDEVTALSWVSEARLRRSWPDRLVLQVSERVPVAVWNDESLVSGNGKLFSALDKFSTEELPHLSGPAERLEAVMDYYHSMSRILRGSGLAIRSLAVDARLTARVELEQGPLLVVDRQGYAGKLRRFVLLHGSVLEQESRRPVRVDLRHADGMAVTWEKPGEPDNDERV